MTREEAIQELKELNTILKSWSGFTEYPQALYIAIDMAIDALSAEPKIKVCEERQNGECPFYTPDWLDDDVSEPSDLISRADAIEAVMAEGRKVYTSEYANAERIIYEADAVEVLSMLPSAEAVQGYTEWLEKIIVEAETFEWLCEETTDEEWCEKNCNYASIQAKCLRHLYEASKGGDEYEKCVEKMEHDIMYEPTYNQDDGSM